ncbi:ketopantoate reductase family protein [Reinekea marinisedimentorum]|uniref:2-dehydropantoate 2-reductase n=1 Tax=Reinekea marinisedimentorum TaxID=230495 RepID=A0A4R3IA98_9GAMM|nr:2-dehydropantoate 2-reductase [Reinekea marinisedimentorum]TCS42084.1 2-dehydropantoate 2-reductase [Reinekea marinisedimentorum]
MPNSNSIIIGPGAIGALACAHSQSNANCLVLAHRKNQKLSKTLQTNSGTIALNWHLTEPTEEVALIWVCSKASAAYLATKPLLEQYPSAYAIMLHNGMGPQQTLSEEFPGRVIWGATTCGAMRKDTNTIIHTAAGRTLLGLPQGAQIPVAVQQLISPASNSARDVLGIEFSDTIEQTLWHKVLINAAINPLTAVHQIANGELLQQQYLTDISNICRETCAIMQQAGITPPPEPVEFILQVARATAKNRSSMAEDIRLNRATEIDYINGFLIAQARLHGLDALYLQKWYDAVAE